jgi:hypothetical protein
MMSALTLLCHPERSEASIGRDAAPSASFDARVPEDGAARRPYHVILSGAPPLRSAQNDRAF